MILQSVANASSARAERQISAEKVCILRSLLLQGLTENIVVRGTQGKGVMPDNTSRFSINGKPIYHFVRSLILRPT